MNASWDANLQKYETHTRGSMQDIPTEVCDSYSNNTEINNTEISDTNPILSGRDADKDERSDYREYLLSQLDMTRRGYTYWPAGRMIPHTQVTLWEGACGPR